MTTKRSHEFLAATAYRDPYIERGVNQPRTIGLQLTWEFD